MPGFNCGGSGGVTYKDFNEAKENISDIQQTWDYLAYKYNCEGSEKAGSQGTTIYTETIKNDGETIATRVTTESADGNTFMSVYTIGSNPPKTKTTIITDSGFTEVWS
ncbi:MAG: hypothetical protein UC390_07635 [Peptococcaceae bacterium]|nr:hypothetical protein [Peptococcaceae bacterium]